MPKLVQAQGVIGGIVLLSGPNAPFFIRDAKLGSFPFSIIGFIISNVAPSSPITNTRVFIVLYLPSSTFRLVFLSTRKNTGQVFLRRVPQALLCRDRK